MIGGSLTCRICHAGPGIPCQQGAHVEAANAADREQHLEFESAEDLIAWLNEPEEEEP